MFDRFLSLVECNWNDNYRRFADGITRAIRISTPARRRAFLFWSAWERSSNHSFYPRLGMFATQLVGERRRGSRVGPSREVGFGASEERGMAELSVLHRFSSRKDEPQGSPANHLPRRDTTFHPGESLLLSFFLFFSLFFCFFFFVDRLQD